MKTFVPSWRGVYSERFLERAIQRPSRPKPPRPPLTDEEIVALPEHVRGMALMVRQLRRSCEAVQWPWAQHPSVGDVQRALRLPFVPGYDDDGPETGDPR